MSSARPVPKPVPDQWKLLARDAVHWRPCRSTPKAAAAKRAYHPYSRQSPPATPSSGQSLSAPMAEPTGMLSPSSDSSLSSLSSPEPDDGPEGGCPPTETDQHYQFTQQVTDHQPYRHPYLHQPCPPCEQSYPPQPLLTPTSALGLNDGSATDMPRLASSASLEVEARVAQLTSCPEQRDYLTPSPTPSRDEWDPTDAWVLWPQEENRPRPILKHMWTSPMHPPELRFLTLEAAEGYEDGLIYALVRVVYIVPQLTAACEAVTVLPAPRMDHSRPRPEGRAPRAEPVRRASPRGCRGGQRFARERGGVSWLELGIALPITPTDHSQPTRVTRQPSLPTRLQLSCQTPDSLFQLTPRSRRHTRAIPTSHPAAHTHHHHQPVDHRAANHIPTPSPALSAHADPKVVIAKLALLYPHALPRFNHVLSRFHWSIHNKTALASHRAKGVWCLQ